MDFARIGKKRFENKMTIWWCIFAGITIYLAGFLTGVTFAKRYHGKTIEWDFRKTIAMIITIVWVITALFQLVNPIDAEKLLPIHGLMGLATGYFLKGGKIPKLTWSK